MVPAQSCMDQAFAPFPFHDHMDVANRITDRQRSGSRRGLCVSIHDGVHLLGTSGCQKAAVSSRSATWEIRLTCRLIARSVQNNFEDPSFMGALTNSTLGHSNSVAQWIPPFFQLGWGKGCDPFKLHQQ